MATRIFLIRHGETAWNIEGRYQGWKDIPLNETGRKQVQELSKALQGFSFSRVISSPLSRARETVQGIVGGNQKICLDSNFREICHGTWEGKLNEEVREMDPKGLESWLKAPHTFTMPNGESLKEVQSRCVPSFQKILSSLEEKQNLLLVSHDAVIKVLLCYSMGLGLENFWKFKQGSTAVNILSIEKNGFTIEILNSLAHLGKLIGDVTHPAL